MIEQILTPALVDAIGWTLLHTLWQGALFALLLGLVLILLRAYSPQARYLISIAFLLGFVVCTGLTFSRMYAGPVAAPAYTATASDPAPSTAELTRPVTAPTDPAEERSEPTPETASQTGFLATSRAYFDRHLPLLVTVWLMGVLVLQLRLLGQLAFVQRMKTYGTERFPAAWAERLQELENRLGIRRPVRYLTSQRVTGPFTAGWLRPVVLLPREMLASLRESQIVTILAHELAHIKRQDFAVNVMQTFLTTFFFYHPGVWWMSARIQDEREHCCDDLAVAATGERIDYARTLVELQERELAAPKLSAAFGGRGFTGRVSRLLTGYLNTATFGEGVVTTLIFAAVLSLAIGTTGEVQASGSAETDERLPETAAPALRAQIQSESEKAAVDAAIAYAAQEAGRQVSAQNFDKPAGPEDTFSLLMGAIYDGNVELVEYLLDKVEDLSRTDSRGFTPLMAAASENQVAIARLLLQRAVDVNQVTRNGWTALTEAADEGSLEVARLLLDAGADVTVGDFGNGRGPVEMAASEGHLDVLRLLLENGGELERGGGQLTALHLAAEEGKTEIVRYLLDEGMNVNVTDGRGRTPLAYAAEEDQYAVVRILLDAGADPEIADNYGATPMVYAAGEGSHRSLEEMTGDIGAAAVDRLVHTPEILLGPAEEGDLFTLKAMLSLGIDIDIADENGNTALSLAAREGKAEIVEFLLDQGANPQGSGRVCSPLFLAARESANDVIGMLASRGGELENGCTYRDISMDGVNTVSDYDGATPLFAAIEENSPASVETLLALGADPNTEIGKTSYLLSERVDWEQINRLDNNELDHRYEQRYRTLRWTPLLEAVETGERRLVRLLLENGADPDHRTEDGLTALDLARQLGHDDIAALLSK